jgi:bifunctional UDP-N-acetylglucosamine pyrophosphorylase/glucosamine-1-phosphate N-acetyltransferase
MSDDLDLIVLAAGKGRRMHQAFPGTPKVLVPLAGRPMLLRLLDAVERAGVASRPIVVVGPAVEAKVRAALAGKDVSFALQLEPRGTGHAVLCAKSSVSGAANVLVLYGDQPLISGRTIRRLVESHRSGAATVTMLTVPLPDFKDWRASFADWGRIVRDAEGTFRRSVEAKDATVTELGITEVNPAMYCFKADWLWKHLPQVTCENAAGEFYLPDLLGLAVKDGERVETVAIEDPREALGANTPEQLAVLEQVFAQVKSSWGESE